MSAFAALVIPGAILCILAALDLGRASALRDSLQGAAEVGVREIVRGLSETAVAARIRASVQAQAEGLAQWDGLVVTVSREGDETATLDVSAPYLSLGPIGFEPVVAAQARARFFCVPPAARWVPVEEPCPEGQEGMVSYEQEEEGYCPSPTSAPTWQATENRQSVVSTCVTP